MAAPSSRPLHPRHGDGDGADALLPSARPRGLHPSACDPTPVSMGTDDGFLHPNRHMQQTLREHDAALGLIEKLDEFWFFDCVFRWRWPPSVCGCEQSRSQAQALAPFRSIEMVHAHCPGVKKASNAFFPKVHFDALPLAGGTRNLLQMVKFSTLAGKIDPECSFPPKELLATANKTPFLDSTAEVLEFLLEETKAEEAGTRNLEQAEEKLEEEKLEADTSSIKDRLEPKALTPSKLEIVESMKKISVSLVPSNTNVHLSRRRRRRKERKNKSKGSEQFEHDETKALMELGFSCSHQDRSTPRVISLLPGMKVDYGEGKNHPNLSYVASTQYKLYGSPDWWTAKPESPLYNWKFPDPHQEGVDMKEHLKIWARAVAATVRHRC